MTSQTTSQTTHRIGTGTGKRARLLALALGAVLAAQVAVIPLTEREAGAVSTEKIFFDSNRTTGQGVDNPTGDYEVFKMNPDGTGVRQLTTNKVDDYRPDLSPGGKRVAYTSYRKQASNPQGDEDVYVMSALDGSGKKNLSNTAGGIQDDHAVISPDGKRVAYESYGKQTSNPQGEDEIYAMNATDGRAKKNLTNNGSSVEDSAAVFSPGGKRIAYTSEGFQDSNPGGDYEVYRMSALDGSGKKNLTDNAVGVDDEGPKFSPDGTRIAYESSGIQFFNAQGDPEVYAMSALDGSGKKNLTDNGSDVGDGSPTFSPDGRKIAYQSFGVQISNPEGDNEVYAMSALDGSGQVNLSYNGDGVVDYRAQFSPDGAKVAYQSFGFQPTNPEGDDELYVVNASDGTGQKNLTDNAYGALDFEPDWGRQAT
jgi:Tol biopolymer transport system component